MNEFIWRYTIGSLFGIAFLAALFGLFCSHVNATALVTVMVAMAGALVLVSILPHIIEFTISPKALPRKSRDSRTK
jgi:predicted membrane channel-forming protein YqfA (hemolysin III family)